MAKKQQDSPAIQLLQLVWDIEGHGAGRSWERLNSAMHRALLLAIEHLFRFDEGDFEEISKRFNFGYWGGAHTGGFAEGFYTTACAVRDGVGGRCHGPNRSACIAFEKYKGRDPFIYKEVRCVSGVRLSCGSRFDWIVGDKVFFPTVTSFAADGLSLSACTYKATDGYERKIEKRFKITLDALREQNAKVIASVKASKKRESEVAA